MNIILFSKEELSPDNTVVLSDERHLHIRDVLKGKKGDTVQCGILGMSKGQGYILSTDRQRSEISYTETDLPGQTLPITLIIGLVRPIQARRILKAAATYGIAELLWVPTALGEKSYAKAGLWEHEGHLPFLVDGASQGGHVLLPNLAICCSLNEAISACDIGGSGSNRKIILHPGDGAEGFRRFYESYKEAKKDKPPHICAAIGSERGWTKDELEVFRQSGFTPYALGPSILRTEDAVHAVLSLLSFIQGQMDY